MKTAEILILTSALFLIISPSCALTTHEEIQCGNYFSGVFMTEKAEGVISVRWVTEGYDDNFSIRYHFSRTEPDEDQTCGQTDEQTEEQTDGYILNSSINRQNISGLMLYSAGILTYPGCRVSGRLLRGEDQIQPFSFKIPDKNSGFEFIVLSDLHSSPDDNVTAGTKAPVNSVINCISSCEDPSFAVISGDLVDDGYIPLQWQEFFIRTSALLNTTVLYTTPGNHEKNSTYYYDLFGYPQFYQEEIGGSRFVFLDSNDNAAVQFPAQKELIDDNTHNSGSDESTGLNFIFFHHPPYSSDGRHPGGWTNIRKAWGDSFENTPDTVVFSGHVHAYERFEIKNATYITCGTGGGELYNLGIYPDDEDSPEMSVEKRYGYMKVKVPPGGSSADISFISPVISGDSSTATGDLKYSPEIIDYSVAGNHYPNSRFMENIMKISEKLPFKGI
ncbi:metallophosphoesterase family protein [Methanoplanus endosymbiosus]|uniref:Metallophosphoesterase n=1 Tax=Methanoplanus endosymbiosus TaxID=33865 RepID=A0A9E7PMP7_9EURY|nr:metallophosphoesterase [Methanoplanus endosymbiosus]UUX93064.1 metallophosphoesterase [Methanoplanus endosymbiosus]